MQKIVLTPKRSIPAEDRETVWTISSCRPVYEMYTTDKSDMLRAVKLVQENPHSARIIKDDEYSMTFEFSAEDGFLFWKPRQKRKMSAEQKVAASERLRAGRKTKDA